MESGWIMKRFIYISLVLFTLAATVYSQTFPAASYGGAFKPMYSIEKDNSVSWGLDKVVNTYIFKGDAFYSDKVLFGNLRIFQSYKGVALKSRAFSYCEDEVFNFNYSLPLIGDIFAAIDQRWVYSLDTRSIGINKLEKIGGLGGFGWRFLENSEVKAMAGVEKNQQMGIEDFGSVYTLSGKLHEFDIEGYKFDANTYFERENLSRRRKQGAFNFQSNFYKRFDEDNSLDFNFSYVNLDQDFLHPNMSDSIDYGVESRVEKRFASDMNLEFGLSETIDGDVNLSLENAEVLRSYDKRDESVYLSGITRKYNEMILNFSGDLSYDASFLNQTFSADYYLRNENNGAVNKFDLNEDNFQTLQEREDRKDNISTRFQLNSRTVVVPSANDEIQLNVLASIFRYDTPSEMNKDDRDEFSSIINLRYNRRFSSILRAGIELEAQANHLVFLKAERSAMNNWNRVVRLSPFVIIRTERFSMSPRLEVLANYTAYDYESLSPEVQSYSFRQLSYKDSLFIYLEKMISLRARINARYFERGILLWNEFAESPKDKNLETFVNALFFYKADDDCEVAFGARYYGLSQKNFVSYYEKKDKVFKRSIGPEAIIRFNFESGSSVALRGWYEFETTTDRRELRGVPNLLLNAELRI